MKPKEALEKLNHTICLNANGKNLKWNIDIDDHIDCVNVDEFCDCYEILDEVLTEYAQLKVKATPMKPKVAWKNEEDESVVGYRCLNCNGSLGAKLDDKPMFPNFCRHCGQKIDWSDEK